MYDFSLCNDDCRIVDNATFTRFFALHFLIPFVIAAIVLIHLIFLHKTRSKNPLGLNKNTDKIPFDTYFTEKDISVFPIAIITLTVLTLKEPHILTDPDNFTPAKPSVTPVHIQPQ